MLENEERRTIDWSEKTDPPTHRPLSHWSGDFGRDGKRFEGAPKPGRSLHAEERSPYPRRPSEDDPTAFGPKQKTSTPFYSCEGSPARHAPCGSRPISETRLGRRSRPVRALR